MGDPFAADDSNESFFLTSKYPSSSGRMAAVIIESQLTISIQFNAYRVLDLNILVGAKNMLKKHPYVTHNCGYRLQSTLN